PLQLVDAVGQQMTQKIAYALAMQIHHAHVRYIEHAGLTAYGVMLVDLRAVVDRHVPAAEVDHARTQFAVGGVQYCFLRHEMLPNVGRRHYDGAAAGRQGYRDFLREGRWPR